MTTITKIGISKHSRFRRSLGRGETIKKFAFFDLDGVLWPDNKSKNLTSIRFAPDARRILKILHRDVIIVSNQTYGAVNEINHSLYLCILKIKFLIVMILNRSITAIYVCPHHPQSSRSKYGLNCDCRKPHSQLFKSALSDYSIDGSKAIMVGDRITDIYASTAAGIHRNFLLKNNSMFYTNVTPNFDYGGKSTYYKVISNLTDLEEVKFERDLMSGNIQILYLCAGLGSRLLPLTKYQHKSLLDVQGQPLVAHTISVFSEFFPKASHIINISHLATNFSVLDLYLPPDCNLIFSYEHEPLGASRTLINLARQSNFSKNILVVHGDLLLSSDYVNAVSKEIFSAKSSTLFTHSRSAKNARSQVLSDQSGLVTGFFNETPILPGEVAVNSGVYFFTHEDLILLEKFESVAEISEGVLPKLIEARRLVSKHLNKPRISIDSFSALDEAQNFAFYSR